MLRLRKLRSTLRICLTLLLARMFGEYIHSGWNGVYDYARYRWRGQDYAIPTTTYQGTPIA